MRRALVLLAILPLFTVPALADSSGKSPHPHMTAQQRFEQANTAHDGRLTLAQAKAGYKSVARHFAAIDQDKKGYVTEDDIRAYNKAQRALHRQHAVKTADPNS